MLEQILRNQGVDARVGEPVGRPGDDEIDIGGRLIGIQRDRQAGVLAGLHHDRAQSRLGKISDNHLKTLGGDQARLAIVLHHDRKPVGAVGVLAMRRPANDGVRGPNLLDDGIGRAFEEVEPEALGRHIGIAGGNRHGEPLSNVDGLIGDDR